MALKREDVALSDERGTFGGYCAAPGFHGDARASSHASRARQAWQRPMEFFQKHLGV